MSSKDKARVAAIKSSIKHWEENAAVHPFNFASSHISRVKCTLCSLYNNVMTPPDDRCRGCPVFWETGRKYCDGTPYENVAKAMTARDRARTRGGRSRARDAIERAVQAELDFLRGLLAKITAVS